MLKFFTRSKPAPARDAHVHLVGDRIVAVEPDYRHFFAFRNEQISLDRVIQPLDHVMKWLEMETTQFWKIVYTSTKDLWGVAFVAAADAKKYAEHFGVTESTAVAALLFDEPRLVEKATTAPGAWRHLPFMSLPREDNPLPPALREAYTRIAESRALAKLPPDERQATLAARQPTLTPVPAAAVPPLLQGVYRSIAQARKAAHKPQPMAHAAE